MSRSAIVGALLGTAAGDALGLPYEAISRRRAARLLGAPTRHRFVFGRGMVSDDTEHTCIVAQSLIASAGDAEGFARALASGLRWWLLGLPAGIGWATLRASVRLWLGFGPHRSGVDSAGNGPAMRTAILGAAVADADALRRLVAISTRITHSDPKAEHAAYAVALATQLASRDAGASFIQRFRDDRGESASELAELLDRAAASVAAGRSTRDFADSMGLGKGISGYAYHTLPVCIHAWLAHPRDFRAAVTAVIGCGGDTDTTAAIVGGIVGAAVGKEGIPAEWLRLLEWPRTVDWMERLGERVDEVMVHNVSQRAPRLFGPWLLLRNVFFLAIVLVHVARRCLPPY